MSKKKILFYSLFFLILFPSLAMFVLAQEETQVIDGDDIIRNFKFVSYSDINKGTFNDRSSISGGKLQIEWGSWNINNVEVIDSNTEGTKTQILSLLNITNRFNIYTNIPITQAAPYYYPVTTPERSADFKRYGVFGGSPIETKAWLMDHTYWVFEGYQGIAEYNSQNHIWSGNFQFEFDIANESFTNVLTGEDGDIFTPDFTYISVYNMKVSNNHYEKITSANINDLTFVPDSVSPESASFSGYSSGTYKVWNWNAAPSFSDPFILSSFDGGILPASVNRKIDVETKDGQPSWNPQDAQKSMPNGRFSLPVPRISPSVIKYGRTLSWTYSLMTQQDLICLFGCEPSYTISSTAKSTTKPSSIEIHNRVIQYDITMEVLALTQYEVTVLRENEPVQKPQEYYDDLYFTSGIGGDLAGTVETFTPPSFWDQLWFWLTIILIAVISILVIRAIGKARKPKTEVKIQQMGYTPTPQIQQQQFALSQEAQIIAEQNRLLRQQLALEKEKKKVEQRSQQEPIF